MRQIQQVYKGFPRVGGPSEVEKMYKAWKFEKKRSWNGGE